MSQPLEEVGEGVLAGLGDRVVTGHERPSGRESEEARAAAHRARGECGQVKTREVRGPSQGGPGPSRNCGLCSERDEEGLPLSRDPPCHVAESVALAAVLREAAGGKGGGPKQDSSGGREGATMTWTKSWVPWRSRGNCGKDTNPPLGGLPGGRPPGPRWRTRLGLELESPRAPQSAPYKDKGSPRSLAAWEEGESVGHPWASSDRRARAVLSPLML